MSNPRSGAPKRVAAGLLAGALSVFGLAFAPSAGAAASVTTERFNGATRYDTAKLISANAAFAAPKGVIVATGEGFADALAASTLAGSLRPAPILLTAKDALSPETSAALTALKGKGIVKVDIVGGTTAVSQATEDAIKALGFTTITRHAGAGTAANRYGTAAQIATDANTIAATGSVAGLKSAFFATGLNFADAVAAAPGAYAARLPILLVNADVPTETSAAITALGIKKAYVLGGVGAISDAVATKLVAATGNPITRIEGTVATSQDRFGTATAIADFLVSTLGFANPTSAILANGTDAKQGLDALASGPLGGEVKAPVILTASLPPASKAWLDKMSATLTKLFAAGGEGVIDAATLTEAQAAAQTVNNDSAAKAVTTRPELTGAAIVNTVTPTQVTPTSPAGTYVRYTFDEALGASFTPVANLFKVYTSANVALTGTTATIETGTGATGTTVLVNFSSLQSAASTATLSKATVVFGAVRDAGGAENPEGDAPIGTAGTTTGTAGVTSAPDLVSVGGFRQGSVTGTTAVDFTFDQAAFSQSSPSAFHLVDVNGVDTTCTGPATGTTTTSGGTVAGGEGTTVVTVSCVNVGGTAATQFSTSNTARGYVTAGAVGTSAAGPITNPLEAADVAGTSLTPDLVSVSYNAASGAGLFTFDEPVAVATGAFFMLYRSTGAEVVGTTATVNPANQTQVSVTGFGLGQTNFVGGSANSGGTLASSAVNTTAAGANGFNRPDEEGFASSGSTITPGRTSGPDLIGVAIVPTLDTFGNTVGYGATYTFDSTDTAAMTGVTPALFHLYLADGTRYNASACTAGTGAAGSTALNTVRCTTYVNAVTGVAPTVATTLQAAVLGTVDAGAATAPTTAATASEGAAATTGGTGTPGK